MLPDKCIPGEIPGYIEAGNGRHASAGRHVYPGSDPGLH